MYDGLEVAGSRKAEGGTCGWGGGNGRGMSYKLGTVQEEKSSEGLRELSDISTELSTSMRETHWKLTYRMWYPVECETRKGSIK